MSTPLPPTRMMGRVGTALPVSGEAVLRVPGWDFYADPATLAALPPIPPSDSVGIYVFRLEPHERANAGASDTQVAAAYERRDLQPSPQMQAEVVRQEKMRNYSASQPHACVWKDWNGVWHFVAFGCVQPQLLVYAARSHGLWYPHIAFMGTRK